MLNDETEHTMKEWEDMVVTAAGASYTNGLNMLFLKYLMLHVMRGERGASVIEEIVDAVQEQVRRVEDKALELAKELVGETAEINVLHARLTKVHDDIHAKWGKHIHACIRDCAEEIRLKTKVYKGC